jgi:glycosyltransferase involved in cell wall biosynthesis
MCPDDCASGILLSGQRADGNSEVWRRNMIRLFLNALGASAGGGLTYVRNVLPSLARRDDVRTTVLVGGALRDQIEESSRIIVLRTDSPSTPGRRFSYEQRRLPSLIRNSDADVLLSAGNFALYRSPVPQILLSGNALYTSSDFLRDLRNRGDYRLWLDTEMKGIFAGSSVRAADCTVAPSAAFASELRQWTGRDVVSVHHGFDPAIFFRDQSPLPQEVEARFAKTEGSLRLLFVSHFNYYRNFETLIQAAAILKRELHPRTVRLILTCKLNSNNIPGSDKPENANPGSYNPHAAAELIRRLRLEEEVVELGAVPYASLHHLYRACDSYVTPAYVETFAHPLVEAMASGLPVIASDLAVHKEICGEAARYFPRFSPEKLAETVIRVTRSNEQAAAMREIGRLRSRDFSWDKHVDQLLQLASGLVGT